MRELCYFIFSWHMEEKKEQTLFTLKINRSGFGMITHIFKMQFTGYPY